MGAIDGIPLRFDVTSIIAGAAYHLSASSPSNFEWISPIGTRCVLRRNSHWLVVEVINVSIGISLYDLLQSTYEDAQCALDLLAVQNRDFLAIPLARKEHILWYRQNGSVIVRLGGSVVQSIRAELSIATISTNGNAISTPVQSLPSWYEFMRYFRYSQIRNDLHVAYRDAFLALESILSSISAKGKGEHERTWQIRVGRLLEAKGLQFVDFVSTPGQDNVQIFFDEQFKANRCALFHSKIGENHILPGSLADKTLIAQALNGLGSFIMQAMKIVFSAGGPVTMLTRGFFQRIIDGFANDLVLAVSPVRITETSIESAQSDNAFTYLNTTFEGTSDGYEFGFLGWVNVNAMKSDKISTTLAFIKDKLCSTGAIEQLSVTGATKFEFSLVWSFSQRAELQTEFDL